MTIRSKQIPILVRPTWLDKVGMSKGLNHDRQHLGIILAKGQTIKARQTNSTFKASLNLRLLNDDRKTESSNKIGSSWVSVSANAVSVPFIDTPYYDRPEDNVEPVVEYDFPGESKNLPVYRFGDDETAFLKAWDDADAEFALIDSRYTMILIPGRDKDVVKSLPGVDNIDGLIGYYESVFAFFNSLAGLSFQPDHESDLNVPNRYFMKADIHGPGGGYYSASYTAGSTNSLKKWWLSPVPTSWGNLHEIAHGYQAYFREDAYFWNGEVSNNIYAACYQSAMIGDRKYKEGWQYNYGKQEQVEKGMIDNITAKKPLDKWDLRAKLYFVMMMLDKAGWDAFADFNKQYRRAASKPGFQVPGHLFLDNLSESTIRVANLDVSPFVQISNGYISPVQLERNQFSQARPVYPLSLLVQGETLTKLQEDLKLQSPFNLVEGQQLLASGVDGDVKLLLEVNEFEQIYGKLIALLDGARVVREVMVQDSSIDFAGLPIGVYALRLPTGRNRKYESPDHRYLIVKPGSREVKVAFEPKTASSLASQKIHLPGLAGLIFGTIIVDQVNQILEVAVTRKSPHSYYGSKTYAEIIIKDKTGNEKFRVTIPGAGAELSYDKIAFEPGYTLQIYHAELSRPVVLTPAYEGIFDPKAKTDEFEITASGLRNLSLKNDPLKGVLNRIDLAATELRSRPSMLRAEPTAKIDIWLAMDLFPGSERNRLLKQYADCLPSDNDPPMEGLGNAFTVDFRGIGDRRFLKVDLDLNRRKLTVRLEAGVAHHYFRDTYASLQYMDADGNELLSMDIKGITNQKTKEWPLSISGYGGEVLKIRHEEPNTRLVVTNNMQNRRLSSREKLQNYRIISTGLERIA